jgi:hypothetical protein
VELRDDGPVGDGVAPSEFRRKVVDVLGEVGSERPRPKRIAERESELAVAGGDVELLLEASPKDGSRRSR